MKAEAENGEYFAMNIENRLFNAVAFDMDGLMFNTEDVYWKAADVLLGRRGCSYTEELCNDIMGRPPQYCFQRMIEYYGLSDDWRDLKAESEEIFIALLKEGYSAMPGLFELLDRLEAARIPKAICTSSSRKIMEAILEKDRLLSRFAFTITSEDIVRGKPDPEIYLKAANRFDLPPNRLLVLEDSVAGCRSAIRAGAACFIILADHNKHLSFPDATQILNSLGDLKIMENLTLRKDL
ncbi:MAG: HAD family phosphatase [Planctomycetia bacterium]|nr:HAD family phosphatase [Planctomycetia bacterium]